MVKKLLDADKENRKTIKEFKEEGDKVEDRFSQMAKDRGLGVKKATPWQDMNEHWDVEILDILPYKVDIKGMKKGSRQDSCFDPEWVWIELIGVKDMGWLNGKADIIAFEIPKGFILIERKKIINIVKEKVNFAKKVTNPIAAKYCLYSRYGRSDLLTRIHISEIEKNKFDKWES